MRPRSESCRNQCGAVIIWMAFFILVMLMFTGLGVGGAKLTVTRTQWQKAAEATALAGASAINAAAGAIVDGLAGNLAAATVSQYRAYKHTAMPVVMDVVPGRTGGSWGTTSSLRLIC